MTHFLPKNFFPKYGLLSPHMTICQYNGGGIQASREGRRGVTGGNGGELSTSY